jgi:hypothetical protein
MKGDLAHVELPGQTRDPRAFLHHANAKSNGGLNHKGPQDVPNSNPALWKAY